MSLPPKREGPPKQLTQPGENAVKFVHAWVMQGRVVLCAHCEGTVFQKRRLMLNTKGLTFLELDWLNAEANVLVCEQCSHMEWFLNEPVHIQVREEEILRRKR